MGTPMGTVDIKEGLILVANGGVCRVIKLLAKDELLVASQKDGSKYKVSLGEIELLPILSSDGLELISPEVNQEVESYAQEEVEVARERFDAIAEYLAGKVSLGDTLKYLGVSKSHFFRLRNNYSAEMGLVSLLRRKRGVRTNSFRLGDQVEDIIQKSIDEKYNGNSASMGGVFSDVNVKCIESGLRTPSKSTVRKRIKNRDAREITLKKEGKDAASQKHDGRPGSKKVTRPLAFTQMDHTLVDVILVDDNERRPLGRPWLTVIIDLYSRVILGYYLSLHAPSTVSVSCAITHAALPKHTFMSRLGIGVDAYPFYGVPSEIGMDNAKEFKSKKFQKACSLNGIKPSWRPPEKKHYGGHVERLFGTLMIGNVHLLPGTTYSSVKSRKDYDSDKQSSLTFKEFCAWFARQVALYHARTHSALKMSPAAKWKEYYCPDRGGSAHPAIISDPFKFKLDFMPEEYRPIKTGGIDLNGYKYWSSSISHNVGKEKYKVKYDPFSLKTIWVYIDGDYVPVNFSDSTLADRSLTEHKCMVRYNRLVGASRSGELEDHSLISLAQEADSLVENSKKETRRARKAAAAKKEYLDAQHGERVSDLVESGGDKEKVNYAVRATLFKGASYD